MEQTCARAVAMGLPAVAFTEHADYTRWTVLDSGPDADEHLTAHATPEGTLHLLAVENELNNRPRRILHDRAPAELFARLLASENPSVLRR